MKVFAHRGYSFKYPENTLLAFKKAIELNAKCIELDVHLSKDNHLVVIHDEYVERTFDFKGLLCDYTLDELKNFNCNVSKYKNRDDCKIPTLREVLELIKDKDIFLNIEAKTDVIHYDLEEAVIKLVNKYNLRDRVLISSFNHKCIANFKNIDKDIKYGSLYHTHNDYKGYENVVYHALALGVYSINLNKDIVTYDIVKLAHENDLKVFVYTVNDMKSINKMREFGVDGIFTDCLDLID